MLMFFFFLLDGLVFCKESLLIRSIFLENITRVTETLFMHFLITYSQTAFLELLVIYMTDK